MKIANINIPGNILLAPMSNVTNLPFRLMCRKYGASLTYSEMISSDAVIYENEKSINRGISCEEERPAWDSDIWKFCRKHDRSSAADRRNIQA